QALIAQLDAELKAAQVDMATLAAALISERARLAAWERKAAEARHGASAEDRAAIASATANIASITTQQSNTSTRIKDLQSRIEKANADLAKYNQALADAASKGLFGPAAEAHAQSNADRAAVINKVIMGAAILLGIAA